MAKNVFLSILIPLYNWDARRLLAELSRQAEELAGERVVEILVLDDASSEDFAIARESEKLAGVSYSRFSRNQGRGAARNHLLGLAAGEYVLFIDADMLPDGPSFLRSYIDEAAAGRDIVCGGISYRQVDRLPARYSFYLFKSRRTEALPAERRGQAPWKYLFTSNILMRRSIARETAFEPLFKGYGFEDIEWGIRLSQRHTIHHIENTCTHLGVMDKEQTFARMRQSVPNFALLLRLHPLATRAAAAARISRILQILPARVLAGLDRVLQRAFFHLHWNPLLLLIFQADKMVLLAAERRRSRSSFPPASNSS